MPREKKPISTHTAVITVSEDRICVSKTNKAADCLVFFFFLFENEEMVFVDQAEMRKGTERKLNSLRSDPRQTFHTFAFLFLKFSTIIQWTRWME